MAERRRIIPASVGPDFYGTPEQPDRPTRRLTVTLPESNDKTSPEFSYIDLVKAVGGVIVEERSFNELAEDDLTGLATLARKFDEKYGAVKGKKKRKQLEDFVDVGLGYDENDPFVDNSECYDELVPSVLTTKFGGFYINSGELQFKELSGDSDDSDFQVQKKKRKNQKKKKRRSLDSDDDKPTKSKKRQLSGASDNPKKKIKKKWSRQFSSGMDEKKKKKKLNIPKAPTIAELLKTNDAPDFKNSNGPGFQNGSEIFTAPSRSDTSAVGGGMGTALENIDPSLDLGMGNLPMDSEMAALLNDTLAGMGDGDDLPDVDVYGGLQPNGEQVEDQIRMPDDIPRNLEKDVNDIKEAARKSMEGKCKFFTTAVNSLLLEIENQTRQLSCGKRSVVYNHLAYHLPCTKDTLLKRAKKLRLGAQDSQLREPIMRLKQAISEVMPAQIERYQEECIAAEQAKQERIEEEEKNERNNSQDEDEEKKGPRSMAPRKKFIWTDHLRNLLCHVVSIKLKTFEMSKTRSQSAEDYLKAFLDAEIKLLWPTGWMQTRMLFKESRSVHSPITSMPPKQKKLIPPPKKKPDTQGFAASSAPVSRDATPESHKDFSPNVSPISGASVSPPMVAREAPTLLDYAESPSEDKILEAKLPPERQTGTLSLLASAMSEVVKKLEIEKIKGEDDGSRVTDLYKQSVLSQESIKHLVPLQGHIQVNPRDQRNDQVPAGTSFSPTSLNVDSFSQPVIPLTRQPDMVSPRHTEIRAAMKQTPSNSSKHQATSWKEVHQPLVPASTSLLKRTSPGLVGSQSKAPPLSPSMSYTKSPSPSTSPSGQEGMRAQMYAKHRQAVERPPIQHSPHSPKVPTPTISPNNMQYNVTSAAHRVSPSRVSPGMIMSPMNYPSPQSSPPFGITSPQSSYSSVKRPNPMKLPGNLQRRGSFPSMLNQVATPPLTSPTFSSSDVLSQQPKGFQQISLSDLARKVPSNHSSPTFPGMTPAGMIGRSTSVDQLSPPLEGNRLRPALMPGMGYLPGQARDPNYDSTSQGQPRLL